LSPAESTQKSKSTGPRTPEGKAKVSRNATRHGLTGRVVVLPSEDMDAFHAFCVELMQSLAPETPLERQYAQTFCDTQWRLNHARSFEDSMLAVGHFEDNNPIDTGHPQVDAALAAGKLFREESKAFVNLTLYEQRLQRTLKESLRQLQELRAERIAARQAALDEAVALRNLYKMKGQSYDPAPQSAGSQFVFSTLEIETEAHRQYRRADAKKAKNNHYDLAAYNLCPMPEVLQTSMGSPN
jgi:hypothetical protein